MERKRYLAMCADYAANEDERGMVVGAAERKAVILYARDRMGYPLSYVLQYERDADGSVRPAHYAEVFDWCKNAVMRVPLADVEPLCEEGGKDG